MESFNAILKPIGRLQTTDEISKDRFQKTTDSKDRCVLMRIYFKIINFNRLGAYAKMAKWFESCAPELPPGVRLQAATNNYYYHYYFFFYFYFVFFFFRTGHRESD